ncbi:prepilin-type N-terminal cleavage/methylation domain-containing protein [Microbacterium sp. HJ5]
MNAQSRDEGFSLVEVIIGMFLLALIAVALLPALVDGVRYSSEQSAVATATRHLHALVEQARENPTCSNLATLAGPDPFNEGTERPMTSSGTVTACAAKSTATLRLVAVDGQGDRIAGIEALIYTPAG